MKNHTMIAFAGICLGAAFAFAGERDPGALDKQLHLAAFEGDVVKAKSLLDAGARLDSVVDKTGATPLHVAAYAGQLEFARLLLEHGADPGTANRSGETPLLLAEQGGKAPVAKLLRDRARELAGLSEQPGVGVTSLYGPALVRGLKQDQNAITMPEFDTMRRMSNAPGVAYLIYLNLYGEVRWSRNPLEITITHDQFQSENPQALVTDAVAQAFKMKAPILRPRGSGLSEIAIPLVADGEVLGMIGMHANEEALRTLIARSGAIISKAPIMPRADRSKQSPELQRSARQHYLSGVIYFYIGDEQRAQDEWLTAQRIDPDDPDSRQWLGRTAKK